MDENGKRARVVIDCDPGVDDAIALMVAGSPLAGFDLAGVTAVAGNLPLADTFRNARALMNFLGRADVPVRAGADAPLVRDPVPAIHHIHGRNGLGGFDLPEAQSPAPKQTAVDFLRAVCSEGTVTLCPIGPLTTVAQLLSTAPEVLSSIDRIVLMGGAAFVGGNVTESAEFNIWADPHAAAVVFNAAVEKVMIGLDVTLQVPADPAWVESLAGNRHRWGDAAAAMLRGYNSGSMALHDPCVPVYLDRPEFFGGTRCKVTVRTDAGQDFGRTVAAADPAGDTLVLTEVDADAVRQHVVAAILASDG